jgi:hypothetical protein
MSEPPSEETKSFPNLMMQSTIYRRHEDRLARTYALREDPRPAVLRVLSGLPGFRIIVPPYQPDHQHAAQASAAPLQRIGVYSEDTLFATITTEGATTTTTTTTSSPSSVQTALQAMLATAICGGTAEFVFGSASHSSTPFKGGKHVYSPFLAHQGDSFGVHLLKRKHFPTPSMTGRQIALAASSTSILFGTKVWMDEQQSSSLLSSACAGALAGLLNAPSASLLARHVVAATLYFSVYERCKQETTGNNSPLGIATAGALAGCVHAAVLTNTQLGWWRCLPAIMRAAPTHALIFTGYETMKQSMEQS